MKFHPGWLDHAQVVGRYASVVGTNDLGNARMEVLFTLLAHRYEHRSVLLTSNLVFSKWEKIFKDPMTTAAAIDRLVHHSIILELNLPSYRMEAAKKSQTVEVNANPEH